MTKLTPYASTIDRAIDAIDAALAEIYAIIAVLDTTTGPQPPVEPPAPPPEPVPHPGRMVVPAGAVPVTAATLVSTINAGASDVVLPAGEYGVLTVNGAIAPIRAVVWCAPGAHFERIVIGGKSSRLTFVAPCVWPDTAVVPPNAGIIAADATTTGIEIVRADVRGHASGLDYARWTLAEWQARERFGIVLEGDGSIIRKCRGLGLRIAWTVKDAGSSIVDNVALGLSEDGSRVVGDGTSWTHAGNYFGDFVTTTNGGRHPDGIVQAWSKLGSARPGEAGMLAEMEIADNVCVELIAASGVAGLNGLAPDHTFRIAPQGIGLHDGSYSDVAIRRNRVWTSAWTGMNVNLKRGTGAVIEDNQVYDLQGRRDHAKITVSGAGIVESGNIASLQNYGAGQRAAPIDYATAPKLPAPPAWDQWSA